ncbi:MAG: AAA family ATPase [Pseudomonadota bacterium]
MSDIKLKSLKLLCKEDEEFQQFGERLSFFHGEMSTGKSSIVELVKFCFGGRLVRTPAISSEVLSVQLVISIFEIDYLLERSVTGGSSVDVSWQWRDSTERIAFPISAGAAPILDDDVYNLSDFLMKKIGFGVIKVPARKTDPDSNLHRLSFRDFYRLCYLDQDELDSSFFLLEQPIRREKTRDVLKFTLGFQSERLTVLQQELSEIRQKQRDLRGAADQIDEFLADYGFNSEKEIDAQIDVVNSQAESLENQRSMQFESSGKVEFISDSDKLRANELEITHKEKTAAILDIQSRISEQEALTAELISIKIKAARSSAATEILERAGFNACPQCGATIAKPSNEEHCSLCKEPLGPDQAHTSINVALIDQDLSERIDDLRSSLRRLKQSLARQNRLVSKVQAERLEIQQKIESARADIESEYMQRARRVESQLGELNERRRQLSRVKAMPAEIERRRSTADQLSERISKLLRQIEAERKKFEKGKLNLVALEQNFHGILKAIHFPEISDQDFVRINPNTWLPQIWPGGNEDRAWSFADAGSGGKKVLFKTAFALALHKTASEMDLPLPRLFIIDSTMKNITPDINKDVFHHFYKEMYRLFGDELSDWQCVIVDQTFAAFPEQLTGTMDRRMTKNDPDNPPLISYYSGH